MRSSMARKRKLGLYALLSLVLMLSLLVGMKILLYSSCLVGDAVGIGGDSDPARRFAIGSVRWDMEQYSRDERLEPFRRYFFEKCPGQAGAKAAMCLSQAFVKAFPNGVPQHEFFDRDFDPVKNFESHL